jgi:hypothetical protein
MHESIDLLFSKLEAQGESQCHMVAQMNLTMKQLTQPVQDQLAQAQQLKVTNNLVVGQQPNGDLEG